MILGNSLPAFENVNLNPGNKEYQYTAQMDTPFTVSSLRALPPAFQGCYLGIHAVFKYLSLEHVT